MWKCSRRLCDIVMDNATPTSSFILTTYWWMKPSLSSLASLFFNEGYTLGQELFLDDLNL
jgi:hypothetical protein